MRIGRLKVQNWIIMQDNNVYLSANAAMTRQSIPPEKRTATVACVQPPSWFCDEPSPISVTEDNSAGGSSCEKFEMSRPEACDKWLLTFFWEVTELHCGLDTWFDECDISFAIVCDISWLLLLHFLERSFACKQLEHNPAWCFTRSLTASPNTSMSCCASCICRWLTFIKWLARSLFDASIPQARSFSGNCSLKKPIVATTPWPGVDMYPPSSRDFFSLKPGWNGATSWLEAPSGADDVGDGSNHGWSVNVAFRSVEGIDRSRQYIPAAGISDHEFWNRIRKGIPNPVLALTGQNSHPYLKETAFLSNNSIHIREVLYMYPSMMGSIKSIHGICC